MRSAGIMMTSAEKFVGIVRILDVASISVTVAHTASTNADIFDGVKILKF